MKKLLFICILLLGSFMASAKNPSPEEILKAIDRNMQSSTSKSVTRMVIHGKRNSRTVSSVNYASGNDKYYTEYTAPPRDKGTKMLKVGDLLYIYDPGTDRVVQISGNMLKQSVMGSDLSYEDFMEETKLVDAYSAVLEGESTYDGRAVWVLALTAKRNDLAYHSCKLWVDKERNVVLYQYLYAKSGKLLKSMRASNVTAYGSRWYPRYILFKDELKEGKGTEYYVDSIEFDVSIPASTFTKAMLKK
jgi:outer membrane lipoprotein-sorting protein